MQHFHIPWYKQALCTPVYIQMYPKKIVDIKQAQHLIQVQSLSVKSFVTLNKVAPKPWSMGYNFGLIFYSKVFRI